jgi:hypothetical protein
MYLKKEEFIAYKAIQKKCCVSANPTDPKF